MQYSEPFPNASREQPFSRHFAFAFAAGALHIPPKNGMVIFAENVLLCREWYGRLFAAISFQTIQHQGKKERK